MGIAVCLSKFGAWSKAELEQDTNSKKWVALSKLELAQNGVSE